MFWTYQGVKTFVWVSCGGGGGVVVAHGLVNHHIWSRNVRPYNYEICLYKLWRNQFEMIINVLVSSFRFIWIRYVSTAIII